MLGRNNSKNRTWKNRPRVNVYLAGVIAIAAAQPSWGQTELSPSSQKRVVVSAPKTVSTASSKNTSAVSLDSTSVRLDTITKISASNGVAAAVPPGFTVYQNSAASSPLYKPGPGERVGDDITLASGACQMTYYNITVAAAQGSLMFDTTVEFWDGDPCDPTSAPIPGTQQTFTGLQPSPRGPTPGFDAWLLEVTLATAVPLPESTWLTATFTSPDAGWPVGAQSEVGFTADVFSVTNPFGLGVPCASNLWFQGDPYAGFLATVNCDLPQAPLGACCTGTSCSQTTEADCLGFFSGPFSSCSPDPCTPGTCCSGTSFDTCTEGSAATCRDGLFTPGATCTAGCPGNFRGYANTFDTGFFNPIDLNSLNEQVLWADDIHLEPGSTCELFGFDVFVTGGGLTAPPTFDAHVELRLNDPGDPTTIADDQPMAGAPGLIAGTAQDFLGIDSDLLPHRLLVSVPPGVMLPEQFWVVLSTSAPGASANTLNSDSGPLLGGPAKVGFSEDLFAIFNDDAFGLGIWSNTAFFGGFDPTGCPGGATCAAAGSFRANVWCRGVPTVGACCDSTTGTCTDGVSQVECPGNWIAGETCSTALFDPPCGTHACCVENTLVPGTFVCTDTTISQCGAMGGSVDLGVLCGDIGGACPSNTCTGGTAPGSACLADAECGRGGTCDGCQNKTGGCFAANGTPGCDDPFCCAEVGAIDSFCMTDIWDQNCADRAANACTRRPPNDDYANAEPITAPPGSSDVFAFDNTLASMDGPTHNSCADFNDRTIANDVWYCWTAPCTSTVFVETCNRTIVDTKIAVYDGCGTPSDATLLDCDDDGCGVQSRTTFNSITGNQYLIRIGTYAGASGGPGAFSITCGAANCPGDADCCNAQDGTQLTGCNDTSCCSAVCACDSFCCDVEWDSACSSIGFNGNGCGAELLCQSLCGTSCPDGVVTFVDPPNRVVDAGTPHVAGDPSTLLTIDRLNVTAPVGADLPECWSLCETAVAGTPNSVASVIDNGLGSYTLVLARPMTPGAATTVTYTTNGTTGVFTSSPGNVNADTATGPGDILAVIDCLNGVNLSGNCPWGSYSSDVDRSGVAGAPDILMVIDLLNGAASLDPWNGVPLPDPAACLP